MEPEPLPRHPNPAVAARQLPSPGTRRWALDRQVGGRAAAWLLGPVPSDRVAPPLGALAPHAPLSREQCGWHEQVRGGGRQLGTQRHAETARELHLVRVVRGSSLAGQGSGSCSVSGDSEGWVWYGVGKPGHTSDGPLRRTHCLCTPYASTLHACAPPTARGSYSQWLRDAHAHALLLVY